MPITLGGTVLPMGAADSLGGLTEQTIYAASKVPQWKNGACTTNVKTYGAYQVYTIVCTEKNVAWANSVASVFEGNMGSALAFIQTADPRINVGTVSIKVLNVHAEVFNLTSLQRDITLTAVST